MKWRRRARFCGFTNKIIHDLPLGDRCCADVCLVEPHPDGVEPIDVDPLGQSGFIAQEPFEFGSQRAGECVGERGQQHTGTRVGTGQVRSPVQRNDSLAGTG